MIHVHCRKMKKIPKVRKKNNKNLLYPQRKEKILVCFYLNNAIQYDNHMGRSLEILNLEEYFVLILTLGDI